MRSTKSLNYRCDEEAKGNTEDGNNNEDILRVLLLLDVSLITLNNRAITVEH